MTPDSKLAKWSGLRMLVSSGEPLALSLTERIIKGDDSDMEGEGDVERGGDMEGKRNSKRVLAKNGILVNLYGSTEVTADCTYYVLQNETYDWDSMS
eukprot:CAMPEP_0175083024 /NCGR_PEP_ID=MMETSP0052_2-20121109/27105_1 /TAXON_ID=51329 ORGANISM="Polytomella parva, Strain SAG 63-3" /NCGR_SAMPLE_ID=MMETSP0052_2 /ASSEMBLY_ACC=CAM_ASM_000194 /LENGTH=96 /DNA_ID=CAMNT_0016354333 /DNA_START=624 /DNA_END=910 /DNA_ORIENTATION=-